MTQTINQPKRGTNDGPGGRWVVLGMLAFAMAMVGLLMLYTEMHTRPFRPLREALAETFEDSAPMVQGGQHKMHVKAPPILRIVMRVDYDPFAETDRSQRMVDRIITLTRQHVELADFEILEIHLFQNRAERGAVTRTFSLKVADLVWAEQHQSVVRAKPELPQLTPQIGFSQ